MRHPFTTTGAKVIALGTALLLTVAGCGDDDDSAMSENATKESSSIPTSCEDLAVELVEIVEKSPELQTKFAKVTEGVELKDLLVDLEKITELQELLVDKEENERKANELSAAAIKMDCPQQILQETLQETLQEENLQETTTTKHAE